MPRLLFINADSDEKIFESIERVKKAIEGGKLTGNLDNPYVYWAIGDAWDGEDKDEKTFEGHYGKSLKIFQLEKMLLSYLNSILMVK